MTSRTIVLTGASRGLGRSLLREFTLAGHVVVACARSEKAVAALRTEYGAPHLFTAVDVSDNAAVEKWAADSIAKVGPPDLLVNNAAIVNANNPLWEVPPEEFARVTDININGTFYVVRHFVPAMVARGAGVIVNFSSGWGRSVSPDVAPYCATKWAIEGLTQALAEELPEGMAAVPLNPGIIHTEMLESCFGAGASQFPTPEQWAKTAAPFILGLGARDNGQQRSVA